MQKQCIPPLPIGDKRSDEVIHLPALLLLQVNTSGTVQIELIVNTWSTQLAQINPSVSLSAVAAQQGCRQATMANYTQRKAGLLCLLSKVARCFLVWEFHNCGSKTPWPADLACINPCLCQCELGNINNNLFIVKQNKEEEYNQCSRNNLCTKPENIPDLYRFQLFLCNKTELLCRIRKSHLG